MFKFSIRDILLLTAIVALMLGWYLNDRAWRTYNNWQLDFAVKEVHLVNNEHYSLGAAYREMENEAARLKADNLTKTEMFHRMQKTLHDSIQDKNK